MAQDVKINIATVGTQQATQQTKTLKQQIKELKDELAQLTKGTDEYAAKAQELGNVMHQQQEIMEDARYATEDYGATLSNLTRIGAGVAGSFAAVQGVMNLMGASTEDAQKAIQTMTSMLGMIQGLSALDQASKAFNGFLTRIKNTTTATREHTVSMQQNSTAAKADAASMTTAATATQAQGVAAGTATKMTNGLSLGFKNLGRAIKSFMASNPFTLILLGATALISVISNLISKTKEEAEELKKMQNEARLAAIENTQVYGTGETDEYKRRRGRSYGYGSGDIGGQGDMELRRMRSELERTQMLLERAKRKTEQGDFINASDTEELEKLIDGEVNLNSIETKLFETRKELNTITLELSNREKQRLNNLVKNRKSFNLKDEDVEQYQKQITALEAKIGELESSLADLQDKDSDLRKQRATEREKQEKEQAARVEKLKQKQLNNLKDQLSYEMLLNERSYKANEITLEEYNNKSIEIRNNYLVGLRKWIKRWGESEKDYQLTIEQTNDQIIANERATLEERLRIRQLENDPSTEIAQRNLQYQKGKAMQSAAATKAQEESELAESVGYYEKSIELFNAFWIKKMMLLDKWDKEELAREHQRNSDKLNAQLEAQRSEEAMIDQEYQQAIEDQERITQAQSDALDERWTNGLISEQEYLEAIEQLWIEHYQKLDEMEIEHITNKAQVQEEQAATMLELQQAEFEYEKSAWEQRKTLVANYYGAFTQIVSGIQGLLTELQGAYAQDSKEYEKIAETNIIISGIMGALEAFQSCMKLGMPMGPILGGILSGVSIATTVAALSNLKSKNLTSSAQKASVNVTPYESISTETGANLEGSIGDTKVYVTEQDISDTQARVEVAESEATF